MNVLSLFAGIGGLDLGLERAGMTVVGQVERDPFRRAVLARHWPEVARHDDVRTAGGWWNAVRRPRVDVVCGGFPCQPFSSAGKRMGMADQRWGWPWVADVLRVVGPAHVLLENSPALLDDSRAFGTVLADLADLGFDARWTLLSACALGAPHARERLFVVAHAHRRDGHTGVGPGPGGPLPPVDREPGAWADPVDGFVAACTRSRGVADGLSRGLDRRRVAALGDAVVPAVAHHIARVLIAAIP